MNDKIILSNDNYKLLIDYMAYRQLLNDMESQNVLSELSRTQYEVIYDYLAKKPSDIILELSAQLPEEAFLEFIEIFGDKEGKTHAEVSAAVFRKFVPKGKFKSI